MSKMIHTDIRIYQDRKQLMRNLKGRTGRTEKTKHFLSTDKHKRENMLKEQGTYVDTPWGEKICYPSKSNYIVLCIYPVTR